MARIDGQAAPEVGGGRSEAALGSPAAPSDAASRCAKKQMEEGDVAAWKHGLERLGRPKRSAVMLLV